MRAGELRLKIPPLVGYLLAGVVMGPFTPGVVGDIGLAGQLAETAVILVIVIGKSVAAFLIVLAFRYPVGTALTVSASLAQIGEFSFILIGLGIAPEHRTGCRGGAALGTRRDGSWLYGRWQPGSECAGHPGEPPCQPPTLSAAVPSSRSQ